VLALASFAGEGEPIDGKDLYLKSIFPAASVFKTIVAAAGIEKGGMTAKTPIQHFGRHHTLYKTQLQKDLKVSQDITLQDAYAYSVNPAFARIALFNVSKDIVADYGERFGFNKEIPFEYAAESGGMFAPDSDFSVAEFASGFNRKTTISPLFGALIAAAICENGAIYEPTVVDSVRSSKRDTLVYKRAPKVWRRAVKEQTASELRWLMNKVTHYGTARKAFRPLRDSPRFGQYEFGGKTGNVNQLGLGRVDWFIGFARNPNDKTKRIAVGVVTTHGEYWTVQSNYIASELFKKYIMQNQNN
jgi:cell division protein FtsI/penicillin-binding protein 2